MTTPPHQSPQHQPTITELKNVKCNEMESRFVDIDLIEFKRVKKFAELNFGKATVDNFTTFYINSNDRLRINNQGQSFISKKKVKAWTNFSRYKIVASNERDKGVFLNNYDYSKCSNFKKSLRYSFSTGKNLVLDLTISVSGGNDGIPKKSYSVEVEIEGEENDSVYERFLMMNKKITQCLPDNGNLSLFERDIVMSEFKYEPNDLLKRHELFSKKELKSNEAFLMTDFQSTIENRLVIFIRSIGIYGIYGGGGGDCKMILIAGGLGSGKDFGKFNGTIFEATTVDYKDFYIHDLIMYLGKDLRKTNSVLPERLTNIKILLGKLKLNNLKIKKYLECQTAEDFKKNSGLILHYFYNKPVDLIVMSKNSTYNFSNNTKGAYIASDYRFIDIFVSKALLYCCGSGCELIDDRFQLTGNYNGETVRFIDKGKGFVMSEAIASGDLSSPECNIGKQDLVSPGQLARGGDNTTGFAVKSQAQAQSIIFSINNFHKCIAVCCGEKFNDVSGLFSDKLVMTRELERRNPEFCGWFIDGYKFMTVSGEVRFKNFSITQDQPINDFMELHPRSLKINEKKYNYCNFAVMNSMAKNHHYQVEMNSSLEVIYRNYLLAGNPDFLNEGEKKILELVRVFKFSLKAREEELDVDELLNCVASQLEISKIKSIN